MEVCNVGGYHHDALQAAAHFADENIVETLIASGAGVTSEGGFHDTALQSAAERGDVKIMKTLITSGADVNCKGGFYGTALHAAAWTGNEKVVTLLIASGVEVGAENGYRGTTLIAAAYAGHGGIVSKLLQTHLSAHTLNFGIKQDTPHSGVELYGTALNIAAARGYEDIVKQLLQAGAKGVSQALVAAATKGRYGIVSMLLAADVVLEELEYEGKSWPGKHVALMRAIELSRKAREENEMTRGVRIIQTFIDAGANVHGGNDAALRKIENSKRRLLRLEEHPRQNHSWDDDKASKQAAKKAYLERLARLLHTNGIDAQAQSDPLQQDVD